MQPDLLNDSRCFKKIIFSPALAFVLFAVLMFIIFNRIPLMPGDDLIVSEMHLKYKFLDYMSYRYNTWSGRLFTDSLNFFITGEFFFLWKWLCTGMTVAASFALYKWVTIGKEMSRTRKCLFAYLCCLGFGIINTNVLSPSVFWVSGTTSYLLPFAMGVIAFTPFVFTLKNPEYRTKTWLKVVSVLCAVFLSFSQEQVALCMIGATVATLIYLLIKTRKVNWFLAALTAAAAVSTLIAMSAPGESLRYAANFGTFPLYQFLEIKQKLAVMAHYTMNTLINQSYLPLMFLWFASGWMLLKKTGKKGLKALAIASIVVSCVMLLRQINPADSNVFGIYMQNFQQLFTFNYLSAQSLLMPSQILPYIFWGVSLLLIPVNFWFAWGRSERSFFYSLIYIAAIASVILMTFSPTLYLSGARTAHLSNMLLLILLYFMLTQFEKPTKLALIIICIAAIKLIFLLTLWNETGFKLWYGVLDVSSIPFKVTY
jgi:hypothetical protein